MTEKWKPITKTKIIELVSRQESELASECADLWKLAKVVPEKWSERTFGKGGDGFWVVAILGNRVVWYNDIEDGFNISPWDRYGTIDGYFCNQDSLFFAFRRLLSEPIPDREIEGQIGPPRTLS